MSCSVKLTKRQASVVEWALDPMDDYWCSESGAWGRDGPIHPESDLPKLQGLILTLSNVDDINDDLLYRLEDQLPDMEEQAAGQWTDEVEGDAKASISAAELIRKKI